MKIKIEKGIPMPEKWKLNGVTEALRKMEVGDSIVIPSKARPNMKNYAARVGIKITTRAVSEEDVRVWRTE